jgi:hypothetical protein
MPFTYDPAKTDTRSKMRAVLSDTDAANPLKDDAEYDGWLALMPDWAATAALARQIAGDFARKVSSFSRSGGIAVSWLQSRITHYESIAATLEMQRALLVTDTSNGTILVGTVMYANDPYAVDTTVEDQA